MRALTDKLLRLALQLLARLAVWLAGGLAARAAVGDAAAAAAAAGTPGGGPPPDAPAPPEPVRAAMRRTHLYCPRCHKDQGMSWPTPTKNSRQIGG